MNLLDRIRYHHVIPVVVLDNVDDANPLAGALVAGGLPIAEVTFRTVAAPDAIRTMAARGDILVGAGTVLTADQVDLAVAAGADFIVSPGTSRSVVERCRDHSVFVLPGAVTATEVQTALELGLNNVKFFPAGSNGGALGVAALAAAFSNVQFVPTGGVRLSHVADYLALPAVLAVGGSWMVPRDRIACGQFEQVRELTAETVSSVSPS